jgi:hypothetical protein
VALHFAFVVVTVEGLPAYLSTGIGRSTTVNHILPLPAVTLSYLLLLAGLAGSSVAVALTFMSMAVQYPLTLLPTLVGQSLL